MEQIKIEIFSKLIQRLTNLSPLMREISEDMIDAVKENFEKEGRPKWKPLAKSTIAERRRLGYWPGKILQRSGMLLRSIFKKYDNTSAVVGTNKIYAAVHQFGGNHSAKSTKTKKIKSIKVPARPFLTLPDKELKKIKKKVETWIAQ